MKKIIMLALIATTLVACNGNEPTQKYVGVWDAIEGENGKVVEMSNRFYIQLYDSINDIPLLYSIAQKTNAVVVGKVPYMPDWYELLAYNSKPNNTLELSNYFYETGLFKNIDPGFIFHYGMTCMVACAPKQSEMSMNK